MIQGYPQEIREKTPIPVWESLSRDCGASRKAMLSRILTCEESRLDRLDKKRGLWKGKGFTAISRSFLPLLRVHLCL